MPNLPSNRLIQSDDARRHSDCRGGCSSQVRFTAELELDTYASLAREVVIRHSSNDRIIALIEVLSPGNKSSQAAFQALLTKATAALRQGCHLLLIDLLPPGPRDPQGIHGAVWSELGDDSYTAPPEKPLTLVALFRRSDQKGVR